MSLEKFLRLLKKSAGDGRLLAVAERGELVQLRLLRAVQMRWHFDLHADMQIALAVALLVFHAATLHAKHRARLRAGGNLDRRAAFERRHFNFVT